MRKPILSFLLGSVVLCQIASAQYVQNALPPEDISSRPIFGDNQRLSHTSRYAGPTVPQVRWVASGGAIHEPTDLQGTVVAPQMTAFGSVRYPYYGFFDSLTGEFGGPFGPFWGQVSPLTTFNTAVYVFGDNDVLLQVIPEWPVFILSGGQYEARVISPSPVLGVPDLDTTLRGVPAYRSGFGVYTDGLMSYAVLGDNFGNLFAIGVYWVISNRYTGPFVGTDFSFTPFPPIISAVWSTAVFNEYNDSGFAAYHNGVVLQYDIAAIPAPQISNGFTVMDLSQDDRVDPNDPSSDPDPIPSDSVDRPIVFNRDNTVAYICASNYGRIYAVDALTGDRIWGLKLDVNRRIPIMAGPSLGTDGAGNERLYVIGRTASNRSTLYAIDTQTGTVVWQRALPNVSRCTPTVDVNGRLYFGDDRGFLYCYDANGNQIWRLSFGAPINVSPALMLDSAGDPILVVAVSNRYLVAIQQRQPIPPTGGTIGVGAIGGGAQ
ncbi:MAG: PQQ-binding-like beta-propeller repeat protein [Fimbriimonadales bacterium]|jgi:hypothetical protein|nr:PQQ-binding-like beta-propeller repeat protein [Fimbriimonadales bacterium]GBC90501.1 Outer membrane protein assembly factor BamB [bacterium HR14]